ncbi:hypothetical protein H8959_011996 [Pygathrix nigripes]
MLRVCAQGWHAQGLPHGTNSLLKGGTETNQSTPTRLLKTGQEIMSNEGQEVILSV